MSETVKQGRWQDGEVDGGPSGVIYRWENPHVWVRMTAADANALEQRITDLEGLVHRMRDLMEDYNASLMVVGCRWCHVGGSTLTELKHADDCVLVLDRAAAVEEEKS